MPRSPLRSSTVNFPGCWDSAGKSDPLHSCDLFVDSSGDLPYVRALKRESGGGRPPTFRRPEKFAVAAAGFETRRRTAGSPGAVVFSCPVGIAAPGFSVTCRSASGRAGRWDVKTVYEEVM